MTKLRSDVDVRQLTTEENQYAALHLNETDENRANAIAEIERWIRESDDLCARTDDFFILRFLRACKFNVEKTKVKIRNYYQQRSDLPEWYENRNPLLPEIQKTFDLGTFMPLRKVDEHGRLVIIVRPTQHDPYTQTLTDLIKACIMILDLATRDHVSGSLHGVVAIIDIIGVTIGHVIQLRPNLIKNLVYTWQGCYPLRIQSISFINVPLYVDVILNIFKQFMNAKLKQRLRVYRNINGTKGEWRAGLPDDILPVEYGGTANTIKELKEYWKKVVEDNSDWLADSEKYKVVSSKREN